MRVVLVFYEAPGDRPATNIYVENDQNDMPFYSARAPQQLIRKFLDFLHVPYKESGSEIVLEDLSKEILHRIIIYAGVRQFFKELGDYLESWLMDIVRDLTATEIMFWASHFLRAYGNYRETRRVAKAFRVLYYF